MIGAVIKDNIVQNLIVIREAQIPEMEKALGCEIVNGKYYGLQAGDLRTANGWTRNAGGEQMILQPVHQENYDTYSVNTRKIIALEAAQPAIAEGGTQAAINILTGVDTQEVVKDDKRTETETA